VLELEQRLTEVELSTDHHHMEHHLAFDALPEKLWASLGENGMKDDEFMLGAGI
jgi:serine O-acetyltransferase